MSGDDRLRVEVLGPIRVRDPHGRDVTPDGMLQRRLLALLVLRRGRVVSVDAAIDVLWPDRPPRDPVAALHNHLFRLRRGLPDELIESTGHGYRVTPSKIDLDADRLAAALNDGAPADPAALLATIDGVLARWHGPAYPELDDVDDGRAESIRLGELRIRAVEARAECQLAAGVTDGLVVELAALADEEPLRERPRALLMTALAKSGRQVEALRVYDDFRRLLGDELGIEPSPALAAQHAGLLGGPDEGAWTPACRLPVPVTSLVGRDALVLEVAAMAEAHRLVTLIGPGGVGKTRLLGEVGLHLRATSGGRPVVMCELATAGEDSAVDVVAAALSIDGRPGVGLADRVAAALVDTEIVLLLDNCEHVLDPIANLVEVLLARCPKVTLVTTSRERLRVPAEQLCTVPPLASSAPEGPAVQLFVERARAVDPGFDPDPEQLSVVAEIVRRLDGLPLAIELAAARLHTLDVAEVAAGLDRRFLLLSSGYRTSSRHGSLHAAMSWSFGLLDSSLQETFADLSVFAGPFTVADAAAICDADADTVSDGAEPAGGALARDAGRSRPPVRLARDAPSVRRGTARRQWESRARGRAPCSPPGRLGRGRGSEAGGAGGSGSPHGDRCRAAGAAHGARLASRPRAARARRPAGRLPPRLWDPAIASRRPGLGRAGDRRRPRRSRPTRGGGVGGERIRGLDGGRRGGSGRARRRAASAASERAGGDVPAEVATICGSYELFQGRLDEATTWYRRAGEAAGSDPAQRLLASSTGVLALAYAGDPTAVDAAAEVLAEVGEVRSPYAAYAWFCAGEAELSVDVERARACFVRALELAELTHASFVAGVAGASKASIDARFGDPLTAAEDYRRLITHWRRAGMWSTQWTMLRSIAGLLARLGRHREAAVLVGAVRATQAGHRIFGQDEAALTELGSQLRAVLGDDAYSVALGEGADLDGDHAVELALSAL